MTGVDLGTDFRRTNTKHGVGTHMQDHGASKTEDKSQKEFQWTKGDTTRSNLDNTR